MISQRVPTGEHGVRVGGDSPDRVTTVMSVGAAAAVLGWALVAPAGAAAAAPLVAVVGIVIGVPHGAVDHLVPGWAALRATQPDASGPDSGDPASSGAGAGGLRGWSRLALVLVAYVVAAAVAAAALLAAPSVSFAVFLVVSAVHFGWGETTFAAERAHRGIPRLRAGWWPTLVHGAVVVALPLWSTEGRAALAPLAPDLVATVEQVPASTVTAVVVGLAVVTVAGRLARGQLREATELALLLALFALAPPLAAFGVYFGAWHAVRHTRRLLEVIAPARPVRDQVRAYLRAAAVPTVAALGVLVGLWIYRSDTGVVVTGVSLLMALTFPHVAVVALLDRHRRPDSPPEHEPPVPGPADGRSIDVIPVGPDHRGR